MNLNQVTIPATDMQASTDFFRLMGFLQIVDTPHYARFECPEGDSTFSLSLTDQAAPSTATIYFEHQDLDGWVSALMEKGFVFEQAPTDQAYLWREAVLRDPHGNKLILYWAGPNRKNPPWRVEKRA
ncbi:MAG: VOC family protein [Acidobacteria bacterium]|nr:VOC family protein [Acidobacteriota bacterium]MCB9399275.1 VOC family protein [Acidobacteriota bacterium]